MLNNINITHKATTSDTHLQSSAVHSWRQLTAPSVGDNQCFIGIDLCRRQKHRGMETHWCIAESPFINWIMYWPKRLTLWVSVILSLYIMSLFHCPDLCCSLCSRSVSTCVFLLFCLFYIYIYLSFTLTMYISAYVYPSGSILIPVYLPLSLFCSVSQYLSVFTSLSLTMSLYLLIIICILKRFFSGWGWYPTSVSQSQR